MPRQVDRAATMQALSGDVMESLGEFGKIALTAALAGLFSWLATRYQLKHQTQAKSEELKRHARYLAIRVVCVLDPFVNECAELTYDTGLPSPSGEMEPRLFPPELKLPEDVDWRSIEPDLMYRILGLPNEIAMADQSIQFVGNEISGPPDHTEYFWERAEQYGKLGVTALQLADDLRKTYGIPKRDYGLSHPHEILTRRIAKVISDREVVQKRQAASNAKIAARASSPSDASG